MEKLGDRIKKMRLENNLTQEELAFAIGTTKATVSNYERGKRIPPYPTLRAMAKILNVPESELMSYASTSDEIPVENQIDSKRSRRVKKLLSAFDVLSDTAQLIAIERLEELCKVSEYRQTLPDALQRLLYNRYQLVYETVKCSEPQEIPAGSPLVYVWNIVLQQRSITTERVLWHCAYYSYTPHSTPISRDTTNIILEHLLKNTESPHEDESNLMFVFDNRLLMRNFIHFYSSNQLMQDPSKPNGGHQESSPLFVLVEKETWVVQAVYDLGSYDDNRYEQYPYRDIIKKIKWAGSQNTKEKL